MPAQTAWTEVRGRVAAAEPGALWATFPARFGLSGEATWRIQLWTRDAFWSGSAEYTPAERAVRAPLGLELRPCGRIDAEVVLAGQRPLTDEEEKRTLRPASFQVWTTFTPLDRPGAAPIEMRSLLNANARFGPLAPGRYRMDVGGQRVRATTREVAIAAGEATPLVLEREPERELHDVRVSIVSTISTGAREHAPFLSVVLRSVDEPRRAFRADQGQDCVLYDALIRSPGEGSPGGCVIPGVPAGSYLVEADGPLDALVWPVRTRIEAGGPPLELVLHDDPDERGFRMDVVTAESGAPIDFAWVGPPAPDALFPLPRATQPGDLLAPTSFDPPAGLEWVVFARGRIPRHGTLDEIVPGDRGRVATLALQPGWGTCVRAVTADGVTVAGVALFGDVAPLGTTDARGHADLAAASEPARLEARHPHYAHVGGNVEPDLGRLPARTFDPVRLVMAPRATKD
jgi:hypothetical protein